MTGSLAPHFHARATAAAGGHKNSYAIVALIAVRVFGVGPTPLIGVAGLLVWMARRRR